MRQVGHAGGRLAVAVKAVQYRHQVARQQQRRPHVRKVLRVFWAFEEVLDQPGAPRGAASVCLVTSLHDGMNLVAKEFVASRENERGVLILSTFAGAALGSIIPI